MITIALSKGRIFEETAPLLAAADAVMLDTSALDIEGAFVAALAIVMGKRP